MKLTAIALVLAASVASLQAGLLPTIPDTIILSEWLVCGPFLVGAREGITGVIDDPETFRPTEGDTERTALVQGGITTWQQKTADSLGWLETDYQDVLWDSIMDFYGIAGLMCAGYAYAEIECSTACQALAVTQRVGFSINGTGYQGDAYGRDWVRTPVLLDSGKNRILLSISGFADRKVRFLLIPPPCAVMTIPKDATSPDVVLGTENESWFGIPVLNTTGQKLDSVKLTFATDTVIAETIVSNLPGLGVKKVPVRLKLKPGPEDSSGIKIAVTARWQAEEYSDTVKVAVREPDETRRETFISAIDGSCQYYGIRYPSDYDPGRRYPVIFTLHGAGVEARGQANAYKQKDWAFVVAPTNRRPYGFDWQDWGRLDAIEVLDTVLARLPIDPDQVLLTGGSMGGHGCWHVATSHPDRFAVVAPQASWPTHQLYVPWFMQRSAIFAEPEQLAIRDAALRSDNVPAMLVNLCNLPAFILHGGLDDNVPTLHGRNFAAWLEELGYEYRYREVPERKHWWNYEDLDITVCDDTALMSYIRGKHRVAGPRLVRFLTGDLGTTRGAYWVNIDRVVSTGQDAEIRAHAGDSVITVSTRNIAEFTLELDQRLFFTGNVHIEVDGRRFDRHFTLPALVTLHKDRGKWKLGKARLPRLAKTRTLYGPAKQAMFSPFTLVYGTQDPELANYFRHTATQEAMRWWLRANGIVEVLPDTEVTAAIVKTRNLVLFGGPESNSYTQKIAQSLPIQAKQGRIHLSGHDLGPGLAALFVYPNPENKNKLVLVSMGTDPEHEKLSRFWGLVYSGAGIPDFIVFDKTVRRRAWAGVHAAGFFGPDWQLDPKSSYVRE